MKNWQIISLDDINWDYIINRYFDKHERFAALNHLIEYMPKSSSYKIFGDVWVQNESHYDNLQNISSCLIKLGNNFKLMRQYTMTTDEQEQFEGLQRRDKHLKVYRGCWSKNRHGFSWTLSESIARTFANRCALDGQPIVLTGRVKPDNVIAYYSRRNEQEIVVEPWRITGRKTLRLQPNPPKSSNVLYQMIQSGKFFTEEQEFEKIMMLVHLDPRNALIECNDRLSFYTRFGFEKQITFWSKIQEMIQNITHQKKAM